MKEDGEHGPYESRDHGKPIRNSSRPREAVVEAFRKILEQELEAENPSLSLKNFCVSKFAERGDADISTNQLGAQIVTFAIDDAETEETCRGFLHRIVPTNPEDTFNDLRIVFSNVSLGWHERAQIEYHYSVISGNEKWERVIYIDRKDVHRASVSDDLVRRLLGKIQNARPDW